MPSGRTHAAITTIAALSLYAAAPPELRLPLAGGCLAGILVTPDLDVDEPVRSHYVVAREFGFLPAVIWRLLWLPYGKLIGHRSWVSHMPLLGTLIRAVYLLLAVGLVMYALRWFGVIPPWIELPAWLPWSLVGLAVSDALHWLADISASSIKRKLHRLRRQRQI